MIIKGFGAKIKIKGLQKESSQVSLGYFGGFGVVGVRKIGDFHGGGTRGITSQQQRDGERQI